MYRSLIRNTLLGYFTIYPPGIVHTRPTYTNVHFIPYSEYQHTSVDGKDKREGEQQRIIYIKKNKLKEKKEAVKHKTKNSHRELKPRYVLFSEWPREQIE